MASRTEIIEQLAAELIASEPKLFTTADRTLITRYLLGKCRQFIMDKANDLRVETANRLIHKRDSGVPWTAEETAAAAEYGVRA